MTVGGLNTILGKKMTNFKPVFLSNTEVVINAMDFMGYLHEGISSFYGGENLAVHLKLKDILEAFEKCGIRPYFVFAGGRENRGYEINSKLLKTLTVLRNGKISPTFAPSFQSQLPVGARCVTMESLRMFRARFLVVPHSSLRCTASLAVRLGCPLIASSSDYFALVSSTEICNPTDNQTLRFVPLNYLNLRPIIQHTTHTYVLSAHEFLPLNSELSSVSPNCRPLLTVLLGTDSMPRSRLPPEIHAKLRSPDSTHAKERRFSVLIQWLSQPSNNIEAIVRKLIEAYPEDNRSEFIQHLTDCVAEYIYHPLKDCKCVTKGLQIPDISPCTSTEELRDILDDQCNRMPFVQEDVFNLLRGLRDDRLYPNDFTVGWPNRLIRAYQCGRVLSPFMRALYSSGFSMTSKANDVSVVVCLPLRLLHYRIMLGLERQLGGCVKLVGLNPHATEYVIRDGKAIACMIPVSPMLVNVSRDHTDRILSSIFSTTIPTSPTEPGWILGLSIVLAYCKNHVPDSFGVTPLEQCPVLLALIGCAIVASDESDNSNDLLAQHFAMVANEIDSAHKGVPPKSATFTELFAIFQRVYHAFSSLVNLLESILPHTHESQVLHFLPPWDIFPSGRVVHWLAVDLDSKPPPIRQRVMSLYWLPRLCQARPDISPAKVREFVSVFENVLEVANSLQMPHLPVNYDVREVYVKGLSSANSLHSSSCPSPKPAVQDKEDHFDKSSCGTVRSRGIPSTRSRFSRNLNGSLTSRYQPSTTHQFKVSPSSEKSDSSTMVQPSRGSTHFRGRGIRRRPGSQYADRLLLRLAENTQS